MNNQSIQKLAVQLEPQTDSEVQRIVLILLTNVIGSGFEDLHRLGKDDLIEDILQGQNDNSWNEVDLLIKELIELNPEKAFELAVLFLTLPENETSDLEWKYRYLRGNDLTILGNEKVVSLLSRFFIEGEFNKKILLFNLIRGFILNEKIRSFTKDEAFSTPEFYSMVAALKVGIQLGKCSLSPLSSNLSTTAKTLISNKRIQEQIGWYLDIEDTKDLAQELLNYSKE